jgi:adenylyltransferase/sulfurtransferase
MTCATAGIIGTASMFGGLLQANEAIKSLLGKGSLFVNEIFAFDLLKNAFNHVPFSREASCKTCSNLERPYYKEATYVTNTPCQSDLK